MLPYLARRVLGNLTSQGRDPSGPEQEEAAMLVKDRRSASVLGLGQAAHPAWQPWMQTSAWRQDCPL